MTELGLVRADMREIIGKPFRGSVSYPVSASDVRRWAIAVYFPEPPPDRFLADGAAAPLDFNPFAWGAAETVPTGVEINLDPAYRSTGAMEHNLGVRPPDLRRALNGGMSVSYTGVAIAPGDVVTAESFVSDYTEKQGRLGAMLITEVATVWKNQRGEQIKRSSSTLIRY